MTQWRYILYSSVAVVPLLTGGGVSGQQVFNPRGAVWDSGQAMRQAQLDAVAAEAEQTALQSRLTNYLNQVSQQQRVISDFGTRVDRATTAASNLYVQLVAADNSL